MPSITRDQFTKWNKDCKNGFVLDVQRYVVWGEKNLHKYIGNDEYKIEVTLYYRNDYDEKTSPYGQKYLVPNGKYLPILEVKKLKKLNDSDMWTTVGDDNWFDLSSKYGKQDRKNLSVLKKATEYVTEDCLHELGF